MKRIFPLFIILSILAIVVVAYDFTCGHMDENPFSELKCPLCQAFHSIIGGGLALTSALLFIYLVFAGLSLVLMSRPITAIFLDTHSFRGPPAHTA